MTWTEIYRNIIKLINQNPEISNRFSQDDFINAINDAYSELLRKFINAVRKGALGFDVLEPLIQTTSQAASTSFPYPEDFWELVYAKTDKGTLCRIVPLDEFYRREGNIYLQGRTFTPLATKTATGIEARPNVEEIAYVKKPVFCTVSDIVSGDTSPEINEKYHRLLVIGAAAKLARHVDSSLAEYFVVYQNEFNQALSEMIGGVAQPPTGEGK